MRLAIALFLALVVASPATSQFFWLEFLPPVANEAALPACTSGGINEGRSRFVNTPSPGSIYHCPIGGAASWDCVAGADCPAPPTVWTQTSHGFNVGDWVMYDSSTQQWELLDVSTPFSSDASGFVITVQDVDNFSLVTEGVVTYTHGETEGAALYATTTTPGTVTSAFEGLGRIEWVVGVALTPTTLLVKHSDPIQR